MAQLLSCSESVTVQTCSASGSESVAQRMNGGNRSRSMVAFYGKFSLFMEYDVDLGASPHGEGRQGLVDLACL